MDHPGRLALLARALPAIGLSRSADSRWPLEVGQAGRAGIFGIIWRLLSAYRGTSNGAGSRADSSRGPWSSAELAPRPVRRGRSKPQKNALDSRKMRGMQTWIPGKGKGLISHLYVNISKF